MADELTIDDCPEHRAGEHARQPDSLYRDQEFGLIRPDDRRFDGPIEAIRHAYGGVHDDIDGRSLYAHTRWQRVGSETARKTLLSVPEYNCFDPVAVADALDDTRDDFISVGRESSVCLYFYTRRPRSLLSDLQSIDDGSDDVFSAGPPDELGGVQTGTYPGTMFGTGRSLDTFRQGQQVVVRAWWD